MFSNRLLRWWWFSITLSFFSFASVISRFVHPWNRLEISWSRADLFHIGLILLLVSFLLLAFFLLLFRIIPSRIHFVRMSLIFSILFIWPFIDLLTLTSGLKILSLSHFVSNSMNLENLIEIFGKIETLLKFFLLFIFIISAFRYSEYLKSKCTAVLSILSPTVILYFIFALTYPSHPTVSGDIPRGDPLNQKQKSHIFFFIFDEWSYERTFSNNKPIPEMPTLSRWAEQSTVYHKAYAPGPATLDSIPYLLGSPRYLKTRIGGGITRSRIRSHFLSDNLFKIANANGWASTIVGAYLPYIYWFKEDVRFAFRVSGYKKPQWTMWDGTKFYFTHWTHQFLLLLSHDLAQRFFDSYANTVHVGRVAGLHNQTLNLIENLGSPTFSYFHYPLPHGPFIHKQEGVKNMKDHGSEIETNYFGNLIVLDRKLAEIEQVMRKGHAWESSLIVLTSDHNWRDDPVILAVEDSATKASLLRHVPLLIKMPNQNSRRDHWDDFKLSNLKDFFIKPFEDKKILIN